MNALFKTLEDNLSEEQFNPLTQKAWRVILNVVQETMISDNYDKKNEVPEEKLEKLLVPDLPKEKSDLVVK